ncbi:MAG: DUF4931 domain-containing protein [Patescibacteria group bacterium]|nr:DUF4931 domain-containing protein [Patescibacteria group bacterium]
MTIPRISDVFTAPLRRGAHPQRAELRKDYIQDKYVIIAPRRGKRPHDPEHPVRVRAVTPRTCVFCPQAIDRQSNILTVGGKRDWLIKVIANKYPAVTLDNPRAYGIQEVVVETPDHRPELEDLPIPHITKLFEVYAERTKSISKNKKIEYIIIFKNQGGTAGASILHAHSQIFATDFIPPHLFDKSQQVQAYKLKTGRCVYCDVVNRERRGPRLVYDDGTVVAFTPYASMYNYELWVMPVRHIDNVTMLSAAERRSFAVVFKRVLKKISQLGLPYNYYFHQVVHDEDQHLYCKITPRGSVWAGVEIGSGIIINPVSPEEAAAYYKK